MRKFTAVCIATILAATTVFTAGCGSDSSSGKKETLRVYNWGEYIDMQVIRDFEDEYNCEVVYDLFDSNESMWSKVSNGDQYDVIVPSDYMIERMINEDMLMEIDQSKITNLDKLTDGVNGLDFDPDHTYSVPYFWGTVGILYNKNEVSKEDVESQGWEVLRNTKYKGKIYMYDSERDSFMIALKALGYSMNTEDEKEIQEAYEWLVELNDTMDPVYVTDEVIDNMISGNKDIAVVYSGDGAYIAAENEDMEYYTPEQGTNIWCDAMVIPKDASNPDLAHEFINFVLDNEENLSIVEEVGYTSTNQEVLDEVTAEGGAYEDNAAYVPRTDNDKDEVFHDNETIRKKLTDLWIKVKAAK
jgi:spermidine/putrescine-binding protein